MKIELKNQKEAQLLKCIAERETEAISELYDIVGSWIYSLVLSILKNRSDAEEVTQEVFLQIWQEAHRYRTELGSVRSWLAVIARHLAIDRTRGRLYKEQSRSISAQDVSGELQYGRGESDIVNSAEGRLVMDAMKSLDNGQSEALILSFYHGYSHSDIAEKLKLPLGTVKSRIRNGMNQLRQILDIKVK